MMANTNAVTLSVALLLSLLFLLSNAVDVDPTSITTPRVKDEMTAVDSEPTAVVATASEVEVKPVDRVVFRPAVESISAVNPDLIAHSFRIPFHRRAGRPRCRHGHSDGLIRLPSGHPHRHFHHGEGFRFGFNPDRQRMQEKEEKEFDEEELEHKRKMTKERREKKDDENDSDDDEKMEEFEHKRKKRMRFNNGKAEEFEHEHEKEEWKKFGNKRMRRFRKEREEGGSMDRVHHFFNGFFF